VRAAGALGSTPHAADVCTSRSVSGMELAGSKSGHNGGLVEGASTSGAVLTLLQRRREVFPSALRSAQRRRTHFGPGSQ